MPEDAEAAGQVIATVGWVVLAARAATDWTLFAGATGVADPLFRGGFGLVFLGGLAADHGDAIRGAVSG